MALLPDQEQLLSTLVEASRSVPRTQQQFRLDRFDVDQEDGTTDFVSGGGLDGRLSVLGDDVWALDRHGLVAGSWNTDGNARFTVTAEGYAYYEQVRQRSGDAATAVEEEIRRHLDGEHFRKNFGEAYDRLAAAEEMLWQANPADDLTTVGHKLGEAIQQFATRMIEIYQPSEYDQDPAKTKNRLRAVVHTQRERLGDRRTELLVALADYQDAVNGVVQRLEHGDQKPNDPVSLGGCSRRRLPDSVADVRVRQNPQ